MIFVGTRTSQGVVTLAVRRFGFADVRAMLRKRRETKRSLLGRSLARRSLATPSGRIQTVTLQIPTDLEAPPVGQRVQVRFSAADEFDPAETWIAGTDNDGSECLLRRGTEAVIVPCKPGFPRPGQPYHLRISPIRGTPRKHFRSPDGAFEAGQEFQSAEETEDV